MGVKFPQFQLVLDTTRALQSNWKKLLWNSIMQTQIPVNVSIDKHVNTSLGQIRSYVSVALRVSWGMVL